MATARRPGAVNPMENPAKSNAEIAKLISDTTAPIPEISLPPDTLIELPGGLSRNGKTVRSAVVRELTGEHEERLARAAQSPSSFHFVDTLLACGTESIGDEDDTAKMLRDILVGDREYLILEIRRVTYGSDLEFPGWVCPECESKTDLKITLDEIPLRRLEDMADTVFEVKLRKGKVARVRLANGHDQAAVFDDPKSTSAERDSILLSRCIISIADSRGRETSAVAFPRIAMQMSIPDRRAILDELAKRQPGPRYNDVKFEHQDCGAQVTLVIGLGDLFLGF